MASTFSWVDFSDEDKEKMVQIIRQLRQQDTIDELGIGSVRDSIANILFPGTTTIQTRAKYVLFVPWILKKMEKNKVSSENISQRVKQEEIKLCKSLLKMGVKDGVIGAIAGEGLQRFPSSIYWAGLQTWGIRKFRGSLNDYYQGLNSYYHLKKGNITRDDQEVLLYHNFGENWDEGLPESPQELPGKEGLDLTQKEAQYLLEKLLINCRESLLTNIIYLRKIAEKDFVWENTFIYKLNNDLQIKVMHAQNFSEIMQGAALVYNYLLAEKKESEELINKYKERLAEWQMAMSSRVEIFSNWNLEHFWNLVYSERTINISGRTKRFIDQWIEIVLKNIDDIFTNKEEINHLIYEREKEVKGRRARLRNPDYLAKWNGAAGTGQLDYRWHVVKKIVNDIILGLNK
ncbi:hypothetical protein ES705_09088 [subsurface metagenome]